MGLCCGARPHFPTNAQMQHIRYACSSPTFIGGGSGGSSHTAACTLFAIDVMFPFTLVGREGPQTGSGAAARVLQLVGPAGYPDDCWGVIQGCTAYSVVHQLLPQGL